MTIAPMRSPYDSIAHAITLSSFIAAIKRFSASSRPKSMTALPVTSE